MGLMGNRLFRDVVPAEFFREFMDTPAAKLLDVEVIAERNMHNSEYAYVRWPGPQRRVFVWWELNDGHIVGWNENENRGWTFPVRRKKIERAGRP